MSDNKLILAVDDGGQPEIFYSLQGEGPHIGRPSIFLRTSECNLFCSWCDTPYTWNWHGTSYTHQDNKKYNANDEQVRASLEELVRRVSSFSCPNVVLTGGEPLVQQKRLSQLCSALLKHNPEIKFDVETNGTVLPSEDMKNHVQTFVVSPKLANSDIPEKKRLVDNAMAWFAGSEQAFFKFVVANKEDVAEVLDIAQRYSINRQRLFLMPAAISLDELERNQDQVALWCVNYGLRFSDRLHLRLYGAKRGV